MVFCKQQKDQMDKMKKDIEFRKQEIEKHIEVINKIKAESSLGNLGNGADKGGGGGGSIREAGGSMGKREASNEGEYFYKQVDIIY